MIGAERLDQHPPALVAAARAAGNLRHQLKRAFRRPEIREVQRRVGIDHADQRDVGKIQTLGDHLRAQQDLDLARAKSSQRLLVAARPLHAVRIHPQARGVREPRPDLLLQFLRPQAGVADAGRAAFRADAGGGDRVIAIMADGLVVFAVVRQGDVAIGTADDVPAAGALDGRGIAAAVQQQDDLAVFFQRLGASPAAAGG